MLREVFSSIRHNKARAVLILLMMSLTYFLALVTLTNSFAFYTQKSDVRRMFKTDLRETYLVDGLFIENEDSIGDDFEELKAFVNSRENSVYGAFEMIEMYFDELENNSSLIELNRKIQGEVSFESRLSVSEVIFIDPEIFDIIDFDLSKDDFLPVEKDGERYPPIYAGKALEGIVSIGDVLTLSNLDEKYIVAGFFEGTRWLNENDPVVQPLRSAEYRFIARFSEAEKRIPQYHNMSRHSTVGSTFLYCPPSVAEEFNERAAEMGIKFKVTSLNDFIAEYQESNEQWLKELLFLAAIVLICSAVSIVSVLCVNVLLKKREYGIKIAFGGTGKRVILSLGVELLLLNSVSGIIGFAAAYRNYADDIIESIRDVNLRTLCTSSLPCLIALVIACAALVLFIPAVLLKQYDPAVLIKEEE